MNATLWVFPKVSDYAAVSHNGSSRHGFNHGFLADVRGLSWLCNIVAYWLREFVPQQCFTCINMQHYSLYGSTNMTLLHKPYCLMTEAGVSPAKGLAAKFCFIIIIKSRTWSTETYTNSAQHNVQSAESANSAVRFSKQTQLNYVNLWSQQSHTIR